jgi:hypothetical protein
MIKIWTKTELAKALELRLAQRPWREIAAILGRSESSLWVKLSKIGIRIRASGHDEESVRENLVKLHAELLAAAEGEAVPATVIVEENEGVSLPAKTLADTTVEEDLEASRARILLEEARISKRKYQEVLTERALEDRLVDVFRERLQAFLPSARTPEPAFHPVVRMGRRPESAALLISDTHVGQVVSSTQTNGFGNYCPRVYCERLQYLQEKVLEVLAQHSAGIDELHVFLLGDIVHGGLNHGAEREDNCVIADQFQLATWTLHQFLCALAFRVPSIQVHTVVGNHGRWPGQHKMPTKNRFSNLDHLVYSALQLSLKVHGLTNIHLHLNDAPRQVVEIKGSRFLAAHGDHLRGGDRQFGVPIHSMTRDVNATVQRYAAAEDRPVDYFLVGDKHRSMSLPLARGEYIVNGSMVGVDEFAMSFSPGEAMQLLFGVDEKERKTWSYAIKVGHAPALLACPYSLPEQIQYLVKPDEDERIAA